MALRCDPGDHGINRGLSPIFPLGSIRRNALLTIPKPTLYELRLAWHRMQRDHPDKAFVTHPFQANWIEQDLDEWLESIAARIEKGYIPDASHPCPAPKPGFLIRPGSVLTIEDELAYTFLVGKLYPDLHKALWPKQGNPDIAHALPKSVGLESWIRSDWKVWSKWREDSVAHTQDARYVLTTDIVGFYDNIELVILSSDLKNLSAEEAHINLLLSCLNRWSQPRGRGIPQGYSASHILAKVYLLTLDSFLTDNDYKHLRYVDDIRIFCTEKVQTQQAIMAVGKFLSKRGLNLQGAKTKILSRQEALVEFDGVSGVIKGIQEKLTEELQAFLGVAGGSAPEYEVLAAIENSQDPPSHLLETAFQEHFDGRHFNKTLFHYLLTRLGKAKSKIAVAYCIDAIASRPEETAPVLRYFAAVGLSADDVAAIEKYFRSKECIYDYQIYQFASWCASQNPIATEFVALARSWAFDGSLPDWVRSNAIAVLGEHGSYHDLETIEAQYDVQPTALTKADCIFACRRQEKSRRNAFYKKCENDGFFVRRAIHAAKNEKLR
jgi:hypothetical protein